MRPRIAIPKGGKSPLPSVLTQRVVEPKTAAPTRPVAPKAADPLLDKVVDVKDMSGKVLFRGTPRQWRVIARQREEEARAAAGLPPRRGS
jgi:hypothetical protein